MPRRLFDEISHWAEGVNTSASADQLPLGASPRGINTALRQIGEHTALVGTRPGALTLNSTPISGAPGLIGGFQFAKANGTKFNLLVSDSGRLDKLNTDTTTSVVNAVAFTAGTHYPIFEVANDLCFIVNDVDQKKFDGVNVSAFGIARPAAPTAVAAAGGAMAAGVWDVGLTYFNSATGNESSLSDFTSVTLAAANLKINVSWLAPSDAQVTHVRVYVRQQSVGANAYRAIAGATPAADATWGGYVPATLATVLDISATQYGAFILLAPSTTENNPPAVGLQGPCWHQSRMFLFDSGNVYYSNIKDGAPYPEAFNPNNFQPVNPNDGDRIIGLTSAYGRLFVFKRFSTYTITGVDPNSWVVELLTTDFGLSAMRSICFAEGVLYWWSNHLGPVAYSGTGLPIALGKRFLSASIAADVLNQVGYASVSGKVDEANQTVLWTVPEFGGTRNRRLIPFNYRLNRFEADYWNPFDIYSMWTVESADHLKALYVGNYGGQVFQWAAATNDGVPGATTTKGPVTFSAATTLTDLTATFATVGGGLKERYVYAVSQDRLSIQRRRITSNTATVLTITPAWTVNPNTTYTYVLGARDFQIDTPWMNSNVTFLKKRYEFLLLELASADTGTVVDVDIFMSLDDAAPKRTKTVAITALGGVYDTASLYDVATYAGSSITFAKLRAACVGKAWKARIRNCQPDQDVLLYKVSMQSILMGLKT